MSTILNTDLFIPGGSTAYSDEELLTLSAKRCKRAGDLPYQYLLYDKIYIPVSDFFELIPLIFQFGEGIKDLFESGQIKLIRQQSNFVLFREGFLQGEESMLEQMRRNNGLIATIIEGDLVSTHLDTESAYNALENSGVDPIWLKIIKDNRNLILENTETVDLNEGIQDVSDTSKLDIINFYSYRTNSNSISPDDFWHILSDMMTENNVEYLFPLETGTGNGAVPLANIFMTQVIFNSQLAQMKKFNIDDIAESESVKYSLRFGRLLNDMDYYSWMLNNDNNSTVKTKQNSFLFFQEMTKLPNISKVLEENHRRIKNLIRLKESTKGKSFREWFHKNCGTDNKHLTQSYIDLLSSDSIFEGIGAKVIRFLTTTGVGLIPVIGEVAGAALGAIDTFLLERLDSSKRPKMFIEKIKSEIS